MKMQSSYIKGFSLIELSLGLVVLASLVVVMMMKFTSVRDNEKQQQAIKDLKKIKEGIESYVDVNGYYPCPASREIVETHLDFALGTRNTDGNCTAGTVDITVRNPLPATPGYDIYNFDNDIRFGIWFYPPAAPFTYALENDVLGGTVPCRDIGLPANCLFDPYGNKYDYVIIPELARAGNVAAPPIPGACDRFLVTAGPVQQLSHIKMLRNMPANWDGNQAVLATTYSLTPPTPRNPANTYEDPDYAVIYYGKDGIGARTRAGTRIVSASTGSGTNRIGDNNYQDINHNMISSVNPVNPVFDEYFFMPDNPFDPDMTFGDIIVFGVNDHLRDNTVCVRCEECNGLLSSPPVGGPNRVINFDCGGQPCTDRALTCGHVDTSNLCE